MRASPSTSGDTHRRVGGYRSLLLWARGRTDRTASGETMVHAASGTLALPLAFAAATAVEITVLHLLIPWLWVQVAVAVLSVWSLLQLFCLLAVERVHPHYVDAHTGSLILRRAGHVVATIPRAAITGIRTVSRFSPTAPTLGDEHLYLPNQDGTNLDLTLGEPVDTRLESIVPSWRRAGRATRISLYVDDPADLVEALRP